MTALPRPTPPFDDRAGRTGRLFADSEPRRLRLTGAPEHASNIPLIMLDDDGPFSTPGFR